MDIIKNDPLNHPLDFLVQHGNGLDTPTFVHTVLDFDKVLERNKAHYHEGFLNGYSANWVYHTPDPEHDHPEYVEGFAHGRANAENDEQWAEIQRDEQLAQEWGMLR